MQRLDCPVCREWEVLSFDGPRTAANWQCKKCAATVADCPEVIIRFGNHYLFADNGLTFEDYVNDAARATRHTFAWAEKYRLKMAAENKMVDLLTPESAMNSQENWRNNELGFRWMGRFETALYEIMEANGFPTDQYSYYIPGNGCSTYHYADKTLNAKVAAEKFFKQHKPRRRAS